MLQGDGLEALAGSYSSSMQGLQARLLHLPLPFYLSWSTSTLSTARQCRHDHAAASQTTTLVVAWFEASPGCRPSLASSPRDKKHHVCPLSLCEHRSSSRGSHLCNLVSWRRGQIVLMPLCQRVSCPCKQGVRPGNKQQAGRALDQLTWFTTSFESPKALILRTPKQ